MVKKKTSFKKSISFGDPAREIDKVEIVVTKNGYVKNFLLNTAILSDFFFPKKDDLLFHIWTWKQPFIVLDQKIKKKILHIVICGSLIWLCFLQNVPAGLYTDPNEIAQHLTLKLTDCEKLEFPVVPSQTAISEALQ